MDLIRRAKVLEKLGMKYNGQEYFKEDVNVHVTELMTLSDREFSRLITKIKPRIDDINSKTN